MAVHEEIRDVLCDLLRIGLLRIRALGDQGMAKKCSAEADHLHNLPELIKTPGRKELLSHYYNISRLGFLKECDNDEEFQPLWDRLAKLMNDL
ncbi:MAG TPA: hypothetical protein VFF39_05700 [Verrucomicrobiae bacterium]|nr:hypothetical protein [Verrucomicrobiae bacterium]